MSLPNSRLVKQTMSFLNGGAKKDQREGVFQQINEKINF